MQRPLYRLNVVIFAPVPRRTGAQGSRRKDSSGARKHESMKIKKVDYIEECNIIRVSVSADAAATALVNVETLTALWVRQGGYFFS